MQTIHSLVLFEPRSQDGVPRIHNNISPTLNTAQGGQRQPCVALPLKQQPFYKSSRPRFKGDSETYIDCKVANTLNTFDVDDKRANELIVEKLPVYCVQGNCIDRSDTAGCNGKGWREDTGFTLNTIDRPAVIYCMASGQANAEIYNNKCPTLNCTSEQPIITKPSLTQDTYAITTGYFMQTCEDVAPTLAARDYKDPHLVCYWNGSQSVNTLTANNADGNQRMPDKSNFNCVIDKSSILYIVRRLTPTECARLQGFADGWGIPDYKEDFTNEEYLFWLEVRNTYAVVNGRKVKEYTKPQMVTWYNKLHSDSSEYKMWGNGIALPPTLYCMQGICDVMGFTPLNYHIPN